MIKITEGDKVRYFEERQTGRTTRTLVAMYRTEKDIAFYLCPNLDMCKYHMRKFIDLIPKHDLKIIHSKMQVEQFGKTFIFISEQRFNDPSYYKGLHDYDVFRDHTCFER